MDKKLLFKATSKVFGLNTIAKVCGIGIKVIISRLLGPAGLGIYELVLAITRIGSMASQVGLHQTAVYYISRFYVIEKKGLAKSAIRIGLVIVVCSSTVISLGIWFFRETFITIFFSEHPEIWALYACMLLVPLFGIRKFISFCYRGMKRISTEVIINQLSYPFLLLCGIGILLVANISIEINHLLKMAVVATTIPVLWSLIDQKDAFLLPVDWFREKILAHKMIVYSIPIWGNAMLTVGLAQIDRIFIGVFSTTEELGYYGAAYTLAFMVSFIMSSFNPISQPLMSEAYNNGEIERIQELYRTIVDWTGIVIVPIVGGVFIFGESVLGIVFSEEFRVAYWILCILTIAESINALSGPAGNILIMTNRQKISLYSLAAGFITGVILNLLLIPAYGALGAAIGTGLSVSLINIIRVYQIKVEFNITNRYETLIKIIAVVSLSGGLVFVLGEYVDHIFVEIGIYSILIAGGYWSILQPQKIKTWN